ncbi:aminotransferase-like domain-containing protein [Dactylosporangium cerinum]
MFDDSTTASLAAGLRALAARLSAGDRLPSNRELVEQHRVSPVTVSRAIALLAAEGVVVTRPGSGTYVAAAAGPSRAQPDTAWQTVALTDRSVDTTPITDAFGLPPADAILLDGGYLHHSLQPVRALNAALVRAARRPDAWDRAPATGLATLRSTFANLIGGVSAEDVLVTAGGQSALSLAFRAIAAPGSPILVESPSYPGALAAARAAGLRPRCPWTSTACDSTCSPTRSPCTVHGCSTASRRITTRPARSCPRNAASRSSTSPGPPEHS